MKSKNEQKKYMLSHADYITRNNKPIIILRGVDEKGRSNIVKVKGFEPYFYVKSREYNGNNLRKKKKYQTINQDEVVKIKTNLPRDVSKERKKYEKTWESDIQFPVRYLVDKGIRSGFEIKNGDINPKEVNINEVKPTKLFFDIETSVNAQAKVDLDPDKTNDRIVSIVCRYVNENNDEDIEKVIHYTDEKKMLKEFIDFVNETDPDIILAWNVYFDIGNIFNRSEKYNIDINELSPVNEVYKRGHGDNKEIVCKGRLIIDFMESYDRFYTNENLESKALEDVCKKELGVEHSDFDYKKLQEGVWQEHIDEIIDYNKLDVERMVKLDKKLKIIEHFEQLRRETGCLFEQSYRTSGFVDVLMLRYFKDKYVLPKAERKDKKKFKGGFVELFTGAGLYKWVAVLDFSAHYPTAIKNYNMSPETMTNSEHNSHKVETPMGDVFFKKEPKGILPKMLDDISEMRNKLKRKRNNYDKNNELWDYYNKRQYTMKQLINSFFGYFGYPGSRLYIPELGSAVTAAGRKYIIDTVEYAKEELGYQSRYSDSLDYERKITVKGEKGIENVKIGKFVEEYNCKDYKTIAMDTDNGKVKFENVKQGIKHKYDWEKKGKLLEFNTTRGKTVVTPQHSVYKLENGKPKLVDAKKLSKGDELVSAKNLPKNILYEDGDIIDAAKLDYRNCRNNLKVYKMDINERSYVDSECPYCGKSNASTYHIYNKHNDKKANLDNSTNEYKYLGCKHGESGKIPRKWELNEEFAWMLGYYASDGSASYDEKQMISYGSQNKKLIERVKKFFNEKLDKDLKIIDSIDKRTNKTMYYYRVQNQSLVSFIVDGLGCGIKSEGKKVPDIILNSETKLKKAYLKGYMAGDGSIVKEYDERYKSDFKNFTTKSEDLSIGLNYLYKTVKQKDDINQMLWYYRKDKKGIRELRTVRDKDRFSGAKIREINEVKPTKEFVYDIEVENEHNFLDAEGNILVHNTDSIFISLEGDSKEEIVEAGIELEEKINEYWKKRAEKEGMYGRPKIEFEKLYKRIFFKDAKKRYAGRKVFIGSGKFTDELDITGFEVVRRDESKPTKEALKGLFEIIFSDKGEEDKDVKESEIPDVKIRKMKDHLEEIKSRMENPDCVEDIAKPKPIRKKPEEYSVPYTVHGILWSNNNLDKGFGYTDSKPYIIHINMLPEKYGKMKVKCPVSDKEKLYTERKLTRIALSKDDNIDDWIDYVDIDKHYQKQVVNKVEDILNGIGLSYSEVTNCERQKSLLDF